MKGPLCRLYLITPPTLLSRNLLSGGQISDGLSAADFAGPLVHALDGGDVACVQLRLKDVDDDARRRAADVLRPLIQERGVAFLINGKPQLAAGTGADGVHIGQEIDQQRGQEIDQEDDTYDDARRAVGADAIVGVSCHDSRHLAMEAAEKGADYVAFGAFFATAAKEPKCRAEAAILRAWSTATTVPAVAVGGITVENCPPLVQSGADFLAVAAGVWDYPQGPARAVADFNDAIRRAAEG